MKRAKHFSVFKDQIIQCTTQFEEDEAIVPDYFLKLSNLEKSVLEVSPVLKNRKLPLIKDILDKTKEINDFSYCIYTNVDIALMPHFYDAVFNYINKGHDAIVINRRRLSKNNDALNDLSLMFADLGKSHPGFDCFVFKKELLEKFLLDDICVGISFLEAALVHNIASFAEKPLFVPDAHLTFHIGMDVLVNRENEFYKHNRNIFFKEIYPKLKPYFSLKKFPYGSLSLPNRMVKWMLNPSIFTLNYIVLEKKNVFQKINYCINEMRWRILQR